MMTRQELMEAAEDIVFDGWKTIGDEKVQAIVALSMAYAESNPLPEPVKIDPWSVEGRKAIAVAMVEKLGVMLQESFGQVARRVERSLLAIEELEKHSHEMAQPFLPAVATNPVPDTS